ncbi:peroxisomal membrane protein 11A isoform X2 [Rhineura floridana]|uniref:peroxisomal membrane protein 11A isoform X2 n=1 Tax=Rhineura floridana TaxID=261503 RepID=UPI002AC81AA6|nr:peroxisomal membrane protein 11A isoform X2 [Rhineura floridana]
MMAAKSKQVMQNGSPKELQATCVAASQQPCKSNNALQRVLHLPVVNSACSNLQKTYSVTKQAHPLMASVCGAYERGLQSASSLAAWSMKPVVQKLEPQFAAANALACRGLDHLEQKIPALHQPVEKVTSDLKDSILTHCQSAVRSVRDTLDRVLGLVAKSYEQPKSSMRNTGEYAGTSRVSQLAEAGVDAAIGKLEKLVDFFLPKVNEPPGRCESLERCPTSTFGRIRSLAATAFQRAYKQTTQTIQHTRDKGQELVTWAPGLVGLVGQSTRKVLRILFGVQSPETSWLNKKGQKVPENKRETKKDDKTGKLPKILVKQEETASMSMANSESTQGRESTQPVSTHIEEEEEEEEERGLSYRLLGIRRSSRGHHPLSFLNLDEPLPLEQATHQRRRSSAFEAENTGSRKSAFSPYKEGAGGRRLSEGLYRPGSEVAYTRSHYTGLYGTTFKKD